jgi:hypothetical protein
MLEASELADAVRAALLGYRGLMGGVQVRDVSLDSETTLDDIEPGLYRVAQFWLIWHEE